MIYFMNIVQFQKKYSL